MKEYNVSIISLALKMGSPSAKRVNPFLVNKNMALKNARGTIEERFYQKIKKQEDGCWVWFGANNKNGYGMMVADKKIIRVHRLSYEIHKGSIKEGMCICHTCDNRACVNPEHLWEGTYYDNAMDMIKKGRHVDSRGDRNGRAKLSQKDIIKIKEDYSQGVPVNKIAKELNVCGTTVYDILKGETWNI